MIYDDMDELTPEEPNEFEMKTLIAKYHKEVISLRADLAAARADARRYRWLRHKDNECNVEIPSIAGDGYFLPGFGNGLDATIDAALAGKDAP
jgi:hypothetical protein